ncbi:MAG: lamin tail domain-containing protein [Candidatus Abawacabacteria bacterium]|nr:lamin tail domain-containing protein [Candidatus Abawacabacteria bacterium]
MTRKESTAIFGLAWLISLLPLPQVHAVTIRDVVISEIAWAGSQDSAQDEWLELFNTTNASIDLTGWHIEDDNGAQTYALSGIIPAHSYFLLESKEIATSITADQVRTLSLSNAGDSLVLKNAADIVVDSVNATSGAWPAGNNTTHATMERIANDHEGNDSNNWQTSSTTTTATASIGSSLIGSPKAANGNVAASTSDQVVSLIADKTIIRSDEELVLTIQVANAQNTSNFGLDITYDSSKLQYIQSQEGPFLSDNGSVTTSFQAALLNASAGTVIIGNARTISPLTGRSGNGSLATVRFKALNSISGSTTIALSNNSFLSTPTAHSDIAAWPSIVIQIEDSSGVPPVNGLRSEPGVERYTIKLLWDASATTDTQYAVYRRDAHDTWQLLGETTTTSFIDQDPIAHGGHIIPQALYQYQVKAKKNSIYSTPVTIEATDTRGWRGDNNRSDRVDGIDLENIARIWTVDDTQTGFNPLVDTSIDGIVNGQDLLDLATTWAKTYP